MEIHSQRLYMPDMFMLLYKNFCKNNYWANHNLSGETNGESESVAK